MIEDDNARMLAEMSGISIDDDDEDEDEEEQTKVAETAAKLQCQ